MTKITEVVFIEYYSYDIPKELVKSLLMGAKCNTPGLLTLELKPGHKLIQTGPYILPPIRWIESFEKNAEFIIKCLAK